MNINWINTKISLLEMISFSEIVAGELGNSWRNDLPSSQHWPINGSNGILPKKLTFTLY